MGRRDLHGMAVDQNGQYFTQALDGVLYKINPENGILEFVCDTGVTGVLDLAYKIDADEIWAVDGTAVYRIDHNNGCAVNEFPQVRPFPVTCSQRQVHTRLSEKV